MSNMDTLWPWDRNEEPIFTNEYGYAWYIDETTTNHAQRPTANLHGLDATCFIVKKDDYIIRACVDRSTQEVIADSQNLEDLYYKMDILKVKQQFGEEMSEEENNNRELVLIGDAHGKIDEFYKTTQQFGSPHKIVCVGDFGFKKEHDWFLHNMDIDNVQLLFGNHDWYPYLNEEHSLGDYAYWPQPHDTFFVRGANSIDSHMRTQGVDWFEGEEINFRKWYEIMDEYERIKPTVVVTHDAPKIVLNHLVNDYNKSITNEALDEMFNIHQPYLWVFGHHHKDWEMDINNTKFICLDELSVLNVTQTYFNQ